MHFLYKLCSVAHFTTNAKDSASSGSQLATPVMLPPSTTPLRHVRTQDMAVLWWIVAVVCEERGITQRELVSMVYTHAAEGRKRHPVFRVPMRLPQMLTPSMRACWHMFVLYWDYDKDCFVEYVIQPVVGATSTVATTVTTPRVKRAWCFRQFLMGLRKAVELKQVPPRDLEFADHMHATCIRASMGALHTGPASAGCSQVEEWDGRPVWRAVGELLCKNRVWQVRGDV